MDSVPNCPTRGSFWNNGNQAHNSLISIWMPWHHAHHTLSYVLYDSRSQAPPLTENSSCWPGRERHICSSVAAETWREPRANAPVTDPSGPIAICLLCVWMRMPNLPGKTGSRDHEITFFVVACSEKKRSYYASKMWDRKWFPVTIDVMFLLVGGVDSLKRWSIRLLNVASCCSRQGPPPPFGLRQQKVSL